MVAMVGEPDDYDEWERVYGCVGWSWRDVRPWFRQPRAPEWDKEIYQAALQYTRNGMISTRLDAGYIVSPITLGIASPVVKSYSCAVGEGF